MSHPFIGADSGLNRLAKFTSNGKLIWEYGVSAPFDVWVLPDGNILTAVLNGPEGSGVIIVSPKKEILFSFHTLDEVFGCQPLPNGNILIGELGHCRLIEVNRKGEIIFSLQCHSSVGGHDTMRAPRQLSNGNYLVPHKGEQVVREYRRDGNILMEIPAPGPVFVAIRLPNGNTLFSSEEMVVEVNTVGKKVWFLSPEDVPDMGIKLLTGLQRLPNGNTVVCNWLGHNQEGKGVPLFEVSPDKKVIWSFNDNVIIRNLGNFQLLDVPGDPLRHEVFR